MAKDIMSDVSRYGLIALMGYTAYGLALQGSLGKEFQQLALELRKVWARTPQNFLTGPGGTGGTGGSPAGSRPATGQPVSGGSSGVRYITLPLRDLGGVPLVYDTQLRRVQQDPLYVSQVAPSAQPNAYSENDVFLTNSGQLVSYQAAVAMAGAKTV